MFGTAQPPEAPADEEADFEGEMTSTGTLTLQEDGSGSWASADESQKAIWDADGNGTYHSPEGDGTMSNVSSDAETGTISFTDSMGATGTIAPDGTLNLQFDSDGEGSELDDIFGSAGLGDSDGDSEEESAATDAVPEVLIQLESEAAAGEAGSDGGTDTSYTETSTDQEPVDDGESHGEDDEWPKVQNENDDQSYS